ncbi:MAG: YpdA family putative bacillithiol disulfide reductase [Acidobacteriota bacterium]|nr:YpdA family putative bacillithiol disulfide reductase [Acidobacteriota bacterium]
MSVRDVIIIGAGPSGLATAIAAKHFGLDYLVLEKGALVDAIARFPINMVFFTTPELLEIGGIPLTTPFEKPTRPEALRYYRRVVDTFQLQVSLYEEALSVDPPAGPGEPFAITTRTSRGATRLREARNVVLAMGYYDRPVMLKIPGEDLPHVSHFYKEAHPYYRQRVVIVGGRNSAAEAALEIHRAGGHVTIVHRGAAFGESIKYWVKPDLENRVKEGSIAAHFNTRLTEIRSTEVVVETVPHEGSSQGFLTGVPHEGSKTIPADAVLLLTGYRADPDFMRHAGVEINEETLEPKYSAETYETNVPGLFVAGGQLAGKKTGTVFIENGRFHGEQIAKVVAGRLRS